ncbi:MAG: type II secretion system F family protein [Acidiferrobacterales bacterium]
MATAQKAAKIITFTWEGVNRQGKQVKGEVDGTSDAQVKNHLRKQGINPKKVRKKPKPLLNFKQKITPKDIAVFTRQLATMMQAGLPVVQAFDLVGRSADNPSLRDLIMTIKNDIEGGTNLTEALSKHPLYFDELYCNLVGAGETAGILDSLLDKIATYKEKIESIKSKIKSALSYPTAVVVVAFIITAILLIFVIPQFETLFHDFGADLPALTVMVINLSRSFTSHWPIIFGSIFGTIFGIGYSYKRSKKMQHAVDRFQLKAPIIGEIITKATIARFCRTLSTMFAAGVPLVDALDSVAGATGNIVYYDATMDIKAEVSGGNRLQAAMESTDVFPNMVNQMVGIGEESGELDAMLAKVADIYEEEVDNAVEGLSSLLEPIIMAFLGIVVGGMVVAMYLPIFKLASVV